ncbi:hypothetical protein M885DRAFT_521843 [Pelagophyceae sp. CCMP2097]|nr:hypothetical protein M885DRAFT_521843 [Pelagophyceae sp. CCMP2097]|mmetsp:Transcript_7639/g.24922  ORF Transcript_7639/g.24922 Transcript_7639/m.24922 type:complete len:228 (-) Transcript_7639:236-919(-)
MDALAGYASADSSDGAPAPPAAAADDDFGESEDETDAAVVAAPKQAPSKTGLPSALSALKGSSTASWLQKPDWASAQPHETVDAETQRATVPAAYAVEKDAPDYGDDMYRSYDPSKGWQGQVDFQITDEKGGYADSNKLHINPTSASDWRNGGPRANQGKGEGKGKGGRGASQGGRGAAPGGKTKRANDMSAKDRTKAQRLNGQSGIGENFKVWRSEEEMRQRQQYD